MKIKRLILLICLLVLGACVGEGTNKVEEAKSILTVKWYEVEEKDGVTYYNNEPFSGILETMGGYNHKIQNTEYVDGRKDGKDFLYNIGHKDEILRERVYKEGVLESEHGWYANGNKKQVIELKNGSGSGIEYTEDGEKKWEAKYKSGLLDGEKKWYYPSGKIYKIERYSEGKKDGIQERYYETGEKKYIGKYEKGNLIESKSWFISGQLAREKKDEIVKVYDQQGKICLKTELKKKIKIHYYKGGEIREEYMYSKSINYGYEAATLVTYDEYGDISKVEMYGYDIEKEETKYGDQRRVAVAEYDELGNNIISVSAEVTEKIYDGLGNLIRENDIHNIRVNYEYATKDLIDSYSTYEYDNRGNRTKWTLHYNTGRSEVIQEMKYDKNDKLISIKGGSKLSYNEDGSEVTSYQKYNGNIVFYREKEYNDRKYLIRDEQYEGIGADKKDRSQLETADYYNYEYNENRITKMEHTEIRYGRLIEKTRHFYAFDKEGRVIEEKIYWNNEDNEDYVFDKKIVFEY